MEDFKQNEWIGEEALIKLIIDKGIEDPDANRFFGMFVDRCNEEADKEAKDDPENPVVSNRANIKAQIKIASLLIKAQRKEEALDSLNDVLLVSNQDESTHDLSQEIERMMDNLDL